MTKKRIIGHRGARNIWPENGLTGFREVLKLGVDGVEFDLHPSADGELVVIHDPTLDRTTEARGPVAARSVAELTGIRLKDGGGDRIPRFDEALDILVPAGVELHIELKVSASGEPYPGLERRALDAVRRRNLGRRAVLTSFSPAVLSELRRLAPGLRTLGSMNRDFAERQGGVEALLRRFEELGVELIAVEKSLLAERLPFFLERVGAARLVAWVVNEPADIDRWLAAPIGTITTDRPDLALAAMTGGPRA